MVKWQLIWRLRSLKAKLATSGSMGRLLVPFVEVTEFGLSHGLREVVMRSRHRLGWSPSRVGATDIETLSNKETIRVAAEVPLGRTLHERAYFNSIRQAQARAGEDFVPETVEQTDFSEAQVRAIAFYLPQFHPIPENDAWWGKGFTEWTNVSKAVPQFEGHYQPHLPGELGFYDLRVPEVQRRQVELAQKHGIYGFCFHYYFFDGKRLLERPIEQFVADTTLDFPFCICWANENWTRRWDGLEHEVLMAQVHSEDTDIAFIKEIEPLLRNDRYITVAGRPLIVVYRVTLMPDPRATANRWRTYCRQVGLKEPYLVAAQAFGFTDPAKVGFDAAVEFPPHVEPPEIAHSLRLLNPNFHGRAYSYEALSALMQRRNTSASYKAFKTVVPGWDNEPRKPGNGIVVVGSTPALYKSWLDSVCKAALDDPTPDARLVFINAWNEWGEGAHLEPDRRYGYAYLEATRQVVKAYCQPMHGGPDYAVTAGAERPLKICIASYGFGIGGGELAPIVLANALRARGHHVTFLVMHREVPEPSLRGRLLPDIPVLNWDDCGTRFAAVVKQYGFDVINSHNVAVEYEFYLRGIVPGIPYIATLHGGYETVPRLLTREFVAYLDRTVDRWLYLADKNIEPLLTHGLQGRFTRVFNAAPAPLSPGQATSDLRSALHAREDAVVLVLASRAIYAKGWDIAIEATKQVRSHTGCDVHLLLIGDGEYFRAFQTAARDAPYVHLWGPSSDVDHLIGECDFGVFPSTYVGESFPMFVLECFAAGLPVVATDVGAIREMMTNDDAGIAGALIPASDDRSVLAGHFAAAISAFVRDKESTRIAASHAVSRAKHYDIERLVQIYLDAFTPTPKKAG